MMNSTESGLKREDLLDRWAMPLTWLGLFGMIASPWWPDGKMLFPFFAFMFRRLPDPRMRKLSWIGYFGFVGLALITLGVLAAMRARALG